jgi:hypothetical protein
MRARMHRLVIASLLTFALVALYTTSAAAAQCPASYETLLKALQSSVKPSGGPSNGGLDNNEWAAIVARDGTICAITYSGHQVGDQWPASRAIAAEKAFTANDMSLNDVALSTANLYAQSQPGGYLFGAAISNPAVPTLLYSGDPTALGTKATRWSGRCSAVSSCLAVGCRCMTILGLLADLARAAIRRAQTTT